LAAALQGTRALAFLAFRQKKKRSSAEKSVEQGHASANSEGAAAGTNRRDMELQGKVVARKSVPNRFNGGRRGGRAISLTRLFQSSYSLRRKSISLGRRIRLPVKLAHNSLHPARFFERVPEAPRRIHQTRHNRQFINLHLPAFRISISLTRHRQCLMCAGINRRY